MGHVLRTCRRAGSRRPCERVMSAVSWPQHSCSRLQTPSVAFQGVTHPRLLFFSHHLLLFPALLSFQRTLPSVPRLGLHPLSDLLVCLPHGPGRHSPLLPHRVATLFIIQLSHPCIVKWETYKLNLFMDCVSRNCAAQCLFLSLRIWL